jgi:DNA-binding HxlR family transcriptional regulator
MSKSYRQNCPIAQTMDLVGERWTVLILRELFLGRRRFSEVAAGVPGASTRTVSDRLRMLEKAGIVERRLYNEYPPRAEYTLTPLGRSLDPVLQAMFDWGMRYRLSRDQRGSVRRRLKAVAAGKA